MVPRAVVCLTVFALCVGALLAQERSQPPTVFRSGVDLVTLDVTVLDRDRRPVRGLRAEDFTILEDGQPQAIASFAAMDVPPRAAGGAAWTREIAPDVRSNEAAVRRLFVIVIDDGHMAFDPSIGKAATRIAHDAIDRLGPADLAAVVFTDIGRNQNFTADPVRLRAAVDSLVPRAIPGAGSLSCRLKRGGCDVDTLKRVAFALRDAPGRKTILFISTGRSISFPEDGDVNDAFDTRIEAQEMFRNLEQANVTIYGFDPAGLQTRMPTAADRKPVFVTSGVNESLRSFAESTGGRAITDTNTPWELVDATFSESSAYYTIAYRSTNARTDGRFRRVRIKVDRPGVDVRARSGYFGPKPAKAGNAKPEPSALDTALGRALPSGDLRLKATAAAFASPRSKKADVAIVTGVRELIASSSPEKPAPRPIEVVATAFDSEWRSRAAHRQSIELTLRPGVSGEFSYELLSRLSLDPGRYELRIATESGGRAGSVFLDVDVPDFAKQELSASGILLDRKPNVPAIPPNTLQDLVPVTPTTTREFASTDRVSAFLRIYHDGRQRTSPATVAMRIVDAADRTVLEESTAIAADRFGTNRAADHHWSLPLDRLSQGDYVLTVDVARAARRVQRHVRFSVR